MSCDVRYQDCSFATIYGHRFVYDNSLKCAITRTKVKTRRISLCCRISSQHVQSWIISALCFCHDSIYASVVHCWPTTLLTLFLRDHVTEVWRHSGTLDRSECGFVNQRSRCCVRQSEPSRMPPGDCHEQLRHHVTSSSQRTDLQWRWIAIQVHCLRLGMLSVRLHRWNVSTERGKILRQKIIKLSNVLCLLRRYWSFWTVHFQLKKFFATKTEIEEWD